MNIYLVFKPSEVSKHYLIHHIDLVMLTEIIVGVVLRLSVGMLPLTHWLAERVEITTPTSSWKRVSISSLSHIAAQGL